MRLRRQPPPSSPDALKTASDEELLRLYCRDEDRDVFAELVGRYEAELFAYLCRYVGNATLAEDAFQATFLQVHLKCRQFDETRKVRPWLFAIATNQAIDAQRRNKRHRHVSLDQPHHHQPGEDAGTLHELSASAEPGPEEEFETSESRQAASAAVASLPEPLRTVVHLVYYQGMKYREAADVLEIPVGTVKSRMHTAIKQLGRLFGVTEGEIGDDETAQHELGEDNLADRNDSAKRDTMITKDNAAKKDIAGSHDSVAKNDCAAINDGGKKPKPARKPEPPHRGKRK